MPTSGESGPKARALAAIASRASSIACARLPCALPHRRAVVEVPAPEVVVLAHAAQQHLRVPAPGVRQVEARLQVAAREDDVRRGLRGDLVVAGQLGAPDRLFETGDRGVRPAGVALEAALDQQDLRERGPVARPGARLRAARPALFQPFAIAPDAEEGAQIADARLQRRHGSLRGRVGRGPHDRAQELDVPAAFRGGQGHRGADGVLDHLRVRGSKQPTERGQVAQALQQAFDAQIQNLGRLLAPHVRRFAGLDVEVRPALDVAIEQGPRPVERRFGVGLARWRGRRGGPRPSRAQPRPRRRTAVSRFPPAARPRRSRIRSAPLPGGDRSRRGARSSTGSGPRDSRTARASARTAATRGPVRTPAVR